MPRNCIKKISKVFLFNWRMAFVWRGCSGWCKDRENFFPYRVWWKINGLSSDRLCGRRNLAWFGRFTNSSGHCSHCSKGRRAVDRISPLENIFSWKTCRILEMLAQWSERQMRQVFLESSFQASQQIFIAWRLSDPCRAVIFITDLSDACWSICRRG